MTAPGDGSCAILGEGLSLETFTTKDSNSPILTTIPVLTDVVRLSSNKFYIPSRSKSVLLNITQFDKLTQHLNLVLDLVKNGPPQLSIYKDPDTGVLHIESFDVEKSNACVMGPIAKNVWHAFENTLQLVNKIWTKMNTVLKFYGASNLVQHLGTCLQVKNVTLKTLLNVPSESFDFCIRTLDNSSESWVFRLSN